MKKILNDINTKTISSVDSGLVAHAKALESEQQAMLEVANIDQAYNDALIFQVHVKQEQVERIEDRLESLINRQQARLQQTISSAPGLLTTPSTKRTWQTQKKQQQARLQSLHTRLEVVREIREGMGINAPRIEELATRKMRAENPDLADGWDAMREVARRCQLLVRQKEQRAQSQGITQSLGISRPT